MAPSSTSWVKAGAATCLALSLAALLGCATADPLAGKGSTSSLAVQKGVTQVQADAAAGLVAVPQPKTDTVVCTYDTPEGRASRTVADGKACPKDPPGAKAATVQ